MFQDRTLTGYLLSLPAVVAVALILVVPVLSLLAVAFRVGDGGFGLERFVAFFADPLNVEVFWRTLRLAALVTLVSAVIGYTAALAIVTEGPQRRAALMTLVVVPLMVSPVARTYAWIVILGRAGLLNGLLQGLGLTDAPVRVLFTETAVFLGLLQLFLPYMILSLVSALENLPRDVTAAATVLGASRWQAFSRVTLPLTREGLVIGGAIVFTGSITAYITPAVLGGSRVLMLETLLVQRVNVMNDMASAAVIAVILVAASFAASELLRRIATARGEGRT
jgi:putative spermidine/putrescine transport system permease protein